MITAKDPAVYVPLPLPLITVSRYCWPEEEFCAPGDTDGAGVVLADGVVDGVVDGFAVGVGVVLLLAPDVGAPVSSPFSLYTATTIVSLVILVKLLDHPTNV